MKINLKINLFLIALIGWGTSTAQTQVVNESFENSCSNYANAFYNGCHSNWISTSGTPDNLQNWGSAYQGSRYAHMYIKWNGFCADEERSETVALNYQFQQGVTYTIRYAAKGYVSLPPFQSHSANWVLTNGLNNQTGGNTGCTAGEITPAVPAGSQTLQNTAFNSSAWTMNTITFTPTSNYSQIWFRNTTGCTSSNNTFTGWILLDDVTIDMECQLTTAETYTICGGAYPNICPTGAGAGTQWYYNTGTQMILVHTGACYTPTQAGSYMVMNAFTGCFSQASFNIIDLGGQLNPNFNISTFNYGSYYNIKLDAIQTSWPSGVTGAYWWYRVEDLSGGGCPDWLNYSGWWGSAYPWTANGFTNNFPELDGFACGYNAAYNNHGRFQFNRLYRITRALWSDCDGWTAASYYVANYPAPFDGKRENEFSGLVITPITGEETAELIETMIESGEISAEGPVDAKSDVAESNVVSSSFEVLPNPNNGVFTVALTSNTTANQEIVITDIAGKLVKRQFIQSGLETIDLSHVEKGIYLITVQQGDHVESKKVVIQ